jgi:DNA-3-methyladenine glycosylase II
MFENAVKHLSKKDPELGKLIKKAGILALPPPRNNFESLVHSIVSQQLSTKAAAKIYARFEKAAGMEINPQSMKEIPEDSMREAGLSRQKIRYIKATANAFQENPNNYKQLDKLSDDEVIELLTNIKGIGLWTAQMFLIFTLLREDVFPVGDLGIRRAMERAFFEGKEQAHSNLKTHAEKWKPYRSVASLYLWKSLGNSPEA